VTQHAEIEIERDFDPVMLPSSTTVMMAAQHMHSRRVSAVLVTEGKAELAGIFTERDAISRVLAEGKDPAQTMLAQVMTDNPEFVTPQKSAMEVVQLMQALRCRYLPIVDEGKAVGMSRAASFAAL
jgi:signal-transduction protein with cAMP-binding, CBS, and nucleotidyltransferase domain